MDDTAAFDGMKVLVTGGGRGIGVQIARELSGRGAALVLVGRNEASLRSVAAELPGPCVIREVDLSGRADVDDLVAWCRAEHPDLGGLVNNAAVQHEMGLIGRRGSTSRGDPIGRDGRDGRAMVDYLGPADANIAHARGEIALNLDAAIGLLPVLRAQRHAHVVNVTTGLAFAPKEVSPVYCATKAGLHSFTQALRYQCKRNAPHVRVTAAILPLVDMDMTRGRGSGEDRARRGGGGDRGWHGVEAQ